MSNNLPMTIKYGGKDYCGNCRIRGGRLVFDIPGLGQWATEAALADHKLGEAAQVLAGVLLPYLIKEQTGNHLGEPEISVGEQGIPLQEVA